MSKEEILAAIRQCARELGRVPTGSDLLRLTPVKQCVLRKHFGKMSQAMREAGLEPAGSGYLASEFTILTDWADVTRKLGKTPTRYEYKLHGRFSERPFVKRYGTWTATGEAFRRFARKNKIRAEWADVLKLITSNEKTQQLMRRKQESRKRTLNEQVVQKQKPRRLKDRPVYGALLALPGMLHAPTNESGVVLLFGMVAYMLGFVVLSIQAGFPDGEALREVEPGCWQRVRIEFEFESRTFHTHGHRENGCDLIVCWVHNWPECPESLEVVELSREIARMGTRQDPTPDHHG